MTLKIFGYGFSPILGAVCGLLCLATLPARAADCGNAQTQIEINLCAAESYKHADKDLNEIYRIALKKLKAENPSKIERFKEVQRAWIKFRDLNCKYKYDLYEGGSMAPAVHSECMTELTQVRTNEIPALFDNWPKN